MKQSREKPKLTKTKTVVYFAGKSEFDDDAAE